MMADRLEEAGVPHELEIVKGSAHGIALRSALWEDSVDFLRAILDL
jgi:hypothetical protein